MVAARRIPISIYKDRHSSEPHAWIVSNDAGSDHVELSLLHDEFVIACDESVIEFVGIKMDKLFWACNNKRKAAGILPAISKRSKIIKVATTSGISGMIANQFLRDYQESMIIKFPDHEVNKLDVIDFAAICAISFGIKDAFYIGKDRSRILGIERNEGAWAERPASVGEKKPRIVWKVNHFDLGMFDVKDIKGNHKRRR